VQRRLSLFSTMLRGHKLSQEYQPLEKAHIPINYILLMIAYILQGKFCGAIQVDEVVGDI